MRDDPSRSRNGLSHPASHTRCGEFANRFWRLDRIEVGPATISPLPRCPLDFLTARIAKNPCCLSLQFRPNVHRHDNAGLPRVEALAEP